MLVCSLKEEFAGSTFPQGIFSENCQDCEMRQYHYITAKKALVILTIAFATTIATVDQNIPLWQTAMGNTTHMEYKNS